MKPQVISFHCILKNKFGKVISSTFNNDVITQPGGDETVLLGLVEGLQNLVKGEKRKITLGAEKAYGFYDPSKVIECDREEVPRGKFLRQGDEVTVQSRDGEKMKLRVTGIHGNHLTLDGNHPLAGQDLIFEIEATEARDATAEELQDADESEVDTHLH
jgi:FKBP-type peptidyl-prolyl cis-trans isomerase SlyD